MRYCPIISQLPNFQYPNFNIQYLFIMIKNNTKQMIYLYFGDDDFTICEEVSKEIESFEKKFGGINVYKIDWQNDSFSKQDKLSQLQDGLMSNSLFSSDKMVILKNFLSSCDPDKGSSDRNKEKEKQKDKNEIEKENIILKYVKSPKQNIKVVFIEKRTLDKRGRIYKEFLNLEKRGAMEIREFFMPAGFQFDKWIEKRVIKLGGEIKREAISVLAISLGKGLTQKDKKNRTVWSFDLWEVNNEIEKLISYCWGREITEKDVELLVNSKIDMNVFNLIDSIGLKNKSKSALLLNFQVEKGLNENYILTMLAYQFRNLLRVKSMLELGLSSSAIISETKIHPFVVKKSINQCRNFKLEDLKKIYRKLYDADVAIKTGRMAPRLVLDLLVLSI